MAVLVETDTTFTAGDPEVLFEQQYFLFRDTRTYDVFPDGQKFLMIRSGAVTDDGSGPASQIVLVENWFDELAVRM